MFNGAVLCQPGEVMKACAILLALLALVIGILPRFTDCSSQGRAITLANGAAIPMKCHWAGRAELALAGPLLILAGALFVPRQKESRRSLALLGLALGAAVILLPGPLVGVCANVTMPCQTLMKPALMLAGLLVMATALAILFLSKPPAPLEP